MWRTRRPFSLCRGQVTPDMAIPGLRSNLGRNETIMGRLVSQLTFWRKLRGAFAGAALFPRTTARSVAD
jgi:hypothetical protein